MKKKSRNTTYAGYDDGGKEHTILRLKLKLDKIKVHKIFKSVKYAGSKLLDYLLFFS